MIQLIKTNQLLKTHLHSHKKANENQELETICKNLSETKMNIKGTSDNISNLRNLRDGLNSHMAKIRSNEIIMEPADKGSIVVVPMPEYS